MKQSFLGRFLQSRRLLKALERLTVAMETQSHQLTRLADHLCGPEVLPATPEDLRHLSGVSFSRDADQGRILDFIERFHRASGREPTEEETLEFLEGRPV